MSRSKKLKPFPDKAGKPVAVACIQVGAVQPAGSIEVDGDFSSMNLAIGAKWGTVVSVLTKHSSSYCAADAGLRLSLWVSDEGAGLPANPHASALAGCVLYGDALAFCSKGSDVVAMPPTVLDALQNDIQPRPVGEIRPLR